MSNNQHLGAAATTAATATAAAAAAAAAGYDAQQPYTDLYTVAISKYWGKASRRLTAPTATTVQR